MIEDYICGYLMPSILALEGSSQMIGFILNKCDISFEC